MNTKSLNNSIVLSKETRTTSMDDNRNKKELKKFCKEMLKSKTFIGDFRTKYYVECLKTYRDVIFLHEKDKNLSIDLNCVNRHISECLLNTKKTGSIWIGITQSEIIGEPNGYCILTQLHNNVPFGLHKFKIKKIHFDDHELYLKLSIISSKNIENNSLIKQHKIVNVNGDDVELKDKEQINKFCVIQDFNYFTKIEQIIESNFGRTYLENLKLIIGLLLILLPIYLCIQLFQLSAVSLTALINANVTLLSTIWSTIMSIGIFIMIIFFLIIACMIVCRSFIDYLVDQLNLNDYPELLETDNDSGWKNGDVVRRISSDSADEIDWNRFYVDGTDSSDYEDQRVWNSVDDDRTVLPESVDQ